MKEIIQLLLAGIAACGLLAVVGCASEQPSTSTTTTTEETTIVHPASH